MLHWIVQRQWSLSFLGVDKVETQMSLWFEMTFDRYKNSLGGQNILIKKIQIKLLDKWTQ
jgi:hypothetical protein